MPELGADPAVGPPDAVEDMAGFFESRSRGAHDASARLRRALGALSEVVAESIDAVRPGLAVLHERFSDVADASSEVSGILAEHAAEIAAIERRARAIEADVETAWQNLCARRSEALDAVPEFAFGWLLRWDEVLPGWLYPAHESLLRTWQYAVDEFAGAREAYRRLARERDELDERTRQRVRDVRLFTEVVGDGGVGPRAITKAADLWANGTAGVTAYSLARLGDAVLVRRVWDALDDERRVELIATAPGVLGSLAGLPPWARVAANRIVARKRIAAMTRLLAAERPAWMGPSDAAFRKLESERAYLEQVVAGTVQLYLYRPQSDRVIEMVGEIGADTTDIATYVPGTFTNVMSFHGGSVRQVSQWLDTNSEGGVVSFVWKDGEFPGEDPLNGSTDPLRIVEANDHGRAAHAGARIAAFQEELRVATEGLEVDYNAIGHSWGLAAVTASEVSGARYANVISLAGAGMPEGWQPNPATRYDHFAYTDVLQHAQDLGLVWRGKNPGSDPAFTAHLYDHPSDLDVPLPTQYSAGGVVTPPIPGAEVRLNLDIAAHNLIATDEPANDPALIMILDSLR